ncbi:malto-oligosyltrehalose trehalohydrolase [Roseiarcaceae bacterium H3SJ34-1]|uniref:malto-oligosyltrehalose trehalohydrolase n=1 Tax=Terripilifer ovatus TaxID=3032367 RepID=UPI003AB9AA24|nr:malto-oligosyltrehalose trehalohydrolase [Roseiarcaceae bacterium H3SJ34-1]
MRFGPSFQADATGFSLWAPSVEAVDIELQGRGRFAMVRNDEGWFSFRERCEAGTKYRFCLEDGLCFPDPASWRQSGGVHGWSVVVDPDAYRWQNPGWRGRPWREAVVYEAHAGLMGGFEGVRRRLPELARLGITAIELMPIGDFPGSRNWGYDGVLLYAPAEAYGTPEELKALIDAAHGLGMMVLLDVVYNHFGPDGNYLNRIASGFFHAEDHTPWGSAIAFDDPLVAGFFVQNALLWLNEYRFDGLRLDAVHAIRPAPALRRLGQAIRSGVSSDRQVHLVIENENNEAALLPEPFDAQWNDDFHHCIHVLLTNETDAYYADYETGTADKLARCLASGFAYQGEHSPNLQRPRGSPADDIPLTSFISFIHNHDQIGNRALGERLAQLAAPDAFRAAITLTLLCPHIPMIFMGDEFGSRSPFLFFTDHNAALAEAVRDGRRNEFRHFPAFQSEQDRSRIPDPNDEDTFRQSIPKPDNSGFDWSSFYRTLLSLRSRFVTPYLDGARTIEARALSDCSVMAAWRLGNASEWMLAANFGLVHLPFQPERDLHLLSPSVSSYGGSLPPQTTLAWMKLP